MLYSWDALVDVQDLGESVLHIHKNLNPIHIKEFIQGLHIQIAVVHFITYKIFSADIFPDKCDLKQIQDEWDILSIDFFWQQTQNMAHNLLPLHHIVLTLLILVSEDSCQHKHSLSSAFDIRIDQIFHESFKNPLIISSDNPFSIFKDTRVKEIGETLQNFQIQKFIMSVISWVRLVVHQEIRKHREEVIVQ